MPSRRTSRGAPDSGRGSAPDRFRRGQRAAVAVGLLVSALVHLAVLGLSPTLPLPGPRSFPAELRAVQLPAPEPPPPDVEIPPAPEPIRRPAPPDLEAGGRPTASSRPVFIPHDVPPRLLNADEVRDFLQAFYPPVFRDLGLEGRVLLWLYLDERGEVLDTRIHRTSGHRAFDELALAVAALMRFRPASNQGRTTPVWVSLPIRFDLEFAEDGAEPTGRLGAAGRAAGDRPAPDRR